MILQLYACGTRGSFPTFGKDFEVYGHNTSCYCMIEDDYGLIIDCGSGLKNAMNILKDCKTIDVVLSHVHYDHIMGLFNVGNFFSNKEVNFYGDFKNWEKEEKSNEESIFHISDLFDGVLNQIEHGVIYELHKDFRIKFFESNHGNHTSMIDIYKDESHICYTGDYEHNKKFPIDKWAKGCDLLLFDGSYNGTDYYKYQGWGHSMWEDGCKIARENGIKKLIITHHAPQYDDQFLIKQEEKAKGIFTNTSFAKENEIYKVL